MEVKFYQQLLADDTSTSILGYEVLRDILIPELTGENKTILYWAGKRLAREIFLDKSEDLASFFEKAGWGSLKAGKAKKNQQLFELSGKIIKLRQQNIKQADFLLEAGFLAETLQNQTGCVTEAIIKDNDSHNGKIIFLVQQDPSLPLDAAVRPDKPPLRFTSASEKGLGQK
ncbi:YslB family protein [Liquorilactobacillus oeni]|uniref:DUF2507 domain-containing protein n=1 Tax=Liquorilactobacillus oeni DSM 19972 TaxID=1423777 RepID=A0A0R1MAR4_9LACO|nr:YslB family protein [Liquorilactobacillus oeni]KRL05009.1 hypothetical protein FD46_GL001234 [Liquorilactobacillus oeni DSM 19972]